MAGGRLSDAWGQTRRDWRPELLYGAVGGALTVGIFIVAGWPTSTVASVLIPIGGVLGGAVLVTFGHFLWKLLWHPWRVLKSEVAEVRASLADLQAGQTRATAAVNESQAVANRLLILRELEKELRTNVTTLERAAGKRSGRLVTIATGAWQSRNGALSSAGDLQDTYETLRDAYEALEALRISPGRLSGSGVAALEEMTVTLKAGLAAVTEAIGRYRQP